MAKESPFTLFKNHLTKIYKLIIWVLIFILTLSSMSGLELASTDTEFIPVTLGADRKPEISDDVVTGGQGSFAENLAEILAALQEAGVAVVAEDVMECGSKKADQAKQRAEEEKERRRLERERAQKSGLTTQQKISGTPKGTPTRKPGKHL